jgi:hypothetical protein
VVACSADLSAFAGFGQVRKGGWAASVRTFGAGLPGQGWECGLGGDGVSGQRTCDDKWLKEYAMRAKRLTLQQRREIFHDLVLTQDVVPNVPHSRQIVTKKFEITEAQLRQIEEEGLEKEWPPLSEAVQEQEVG